MNGFIRFVSLRYLFSHGRVRAVHLVTIIATIAIAIIVAASVIILSVFNGFGNLLINDSSPFDSELVIAPSKGGYSTFSDDLIKQALNNKNIASYTPVLYGEGMAVIGSSFNPAKLYGVTSAFYSGKSFSQSLYWGNFSTAGNRMVMGLELYLSLAMPSENEAVTLILPRRTTKINPLLPLSSLNNTQLTPSGVIRTNTDRYNHALFLSIDTLSNLLELPLHSASFLALSLHNNSPKAVRSTAKQLNALLSPHYKVLDKQAQQPEVTKLIAMEKWFTYCILVFIMALAAFNVICSTSLLIIEKQRDRYLFSAIGLHRTYIRQLFIWQSFGASLLGAFGGVILGIVVCMIQKSTSFLTFGSASGSVPYPVSFHMLDLIPLLGMVIVLCFLASWLPTRAFIRNSSSLEHLS